MTTLKAFAFTILGAAAYAMLAANMNERERQIEVSPIQPKLARLCDGLVAGQYGPGERWSPRPKDLTCIESADLTTMRKLPGHLLSLPTDARVSR